MLGQEIPAIGCRGLQAQAIGDEVLVEKGGQGIRFLLAWRQPGASEEQQAVAIRTKMDGIGMEYIGLRIRARAVGQTTKGGARQIPAGRGSDPKEGKKGGQGIRARWPAGQRQPIRAAQKPPQDRRRRQVIGMHRHRPQEAGDQEVQAPTQPARVSMRMRITSPLTVSRASMRAIA